MNLEENGIDVVVADDSSFDDEFFEQFLEELREKIAESRCGVLLNCSAINEAPAHVLHRLHEVQSDAIAKRRRFALFRVSAELYACILRMDVEYPLQCYSVAKTDAAGSTSQKRASTKAVSVGSQPDMPLEVGSVVLASAIGLVVICIAYGAYLYFSF